MIDKILFNRIKAAEAEDIDDLVDIITDFGIGRAFMSTKDKELLVFAKNKTYTEKRYTDKEIKVICEQLQSFSGNTVMNWGRKLFSESFLSYKEIIADAIDKLHPDIKRKIKSSSNNTKVIDASLAEAIFGSNWLELGFKKRYEASLRAIDSVSTLAGLYPENNIGRTLLKSVFSGVGDMIGNGTPTISVPFIAQMGYIELKRIKVLESAKLPRITQRMQTLDEAINNPQPINWTKGIKNNYAHKKQVNLDENSINTFSQLFSNLPSAATAKEAGNTHLMLSNLSFEELTKVKGTADAARGFKHGAKGIDKHIKLTKPQGLRALRI